MPRTLREHAMLRFIIPVRCLNCKYRFTASPKAFTPAQRAAALERAAGMDRPAAIDKRGSPRSVRESPREPEASLETPPVEAAPEIPKKTASEKPAPERPATSPAAPEPDESPDTGETEEPDDLPLLVEPGSGNGWKWIAASLLIVVIAGGVWAFIARRARSNSSDTLPPVSGEITPSVSPSPKVNRAATSAVAGVKGQTRINPADGLPYVYIAAGKFNMGCSPEDSGCDSDEKPAHGEVIANGFWLGQTEVTQAAWKRVNHGADPSHFKGDDLPVDSVTWTAASAYCRAVGGRLPAEKEWEYAARGGSLETRYGEVEDIAWYSGNSAGRTHPAGKKEPNGFGLYDMFGNVWEWTADNYGPNLKTVRGGSWYNGVNLLRASYRERNKETDSSVVLGLRCAEDAR
ncbi:MAG TPA: SUMF1/EgtB/PvdO family nonheme iron enzyme [Bryobacteraceae bacterium]|jgi:formylglycine-generating enzyme required for sulfatase activity|nr:SUMF1/EgtB/PvdO family nonheme iron enzyme [Bryobacteraceae bacterium]